jgi:hypothetical protein
VEGLFNRADTNCLNSAARIASCYSVKNFPVRIGTAELAAKPNSADVP